ncbi:putative potassium uptake protein [Mycolicibacterium cyprinidarum]|uniref:Potassium uptake protein n=1 Tax=Mycolicibacterium cyprinidarum TaxID=2860311 RepID=A0ABQ4V5E3_9MYCO|nr:putative potassium uptake protein [Mycolicibacterium sp. NGTWS1803]GJF09023.1 putative potassium uptake protein [Mycolicibacterium sp. NGTWSNA01]GJF11122.1 putative potassium uptake protein [Mycolicibacterium sp. NGTWS0302]
MRIVIAGAGAVGRSVAQELVDYGHKVLLIEKEFARYAPSVVPGAEWFLADACEVSSLEEAEIQICDVAIAATGDDKSNLAMAFLAKTEFGIDRVVARINDTRNDWLFTESWGVDVAVSTPMALVAAVEGAIDVGHLVRLMDLGRVSRSGLGQGSANVAKLTLPPDSRLVGQRVRDLTMPTNSALVTLLRGNRLIIPEPDTVLCAGDEMLFIAGSAVEGRIKAMMQGPDG